MFTATKISKIFGIYKIFLVYLHKKSKKRHFIYVFVIREGWCRFFTFFLDMSKILLSFALRKTRGHAPLLLQPTISVPTTEIYANFSVSPLQVQEDN